MVRPVLGTRLKAFPNVTVNATTTTTTANNIPTTTNTNATSNQHKGYTTSNIPFTSSSRRSSPPKRRPISFASTTASASRVAASLAIAVALVLAAAAAFATRFNAPFSHGGLLPAPKRGPPSSLSLRAPVEASLSGGVAVSSSLSASGRVAEEGLVPPPTTPSSVEGVATPALLSTSDGQISSVSHETKQQKPPSPLQQQQQQQQQQRQQQQQQQQQHQQQQQQQPKRDGNPLSTTTSEKAKLHPPSQYPHHCSVLYVSGNPLDRSDYPYNSRSFCLTSAVCIRPSTATSTSTLYVSANLSQTTCSNVTSAFTPWPGPPSNCSLIQDYALCAHGRFLPPITPVCPNVLPMSSLSARASAAATWLPGIAFVVPAYPHQANIFHFSFVAGTISHLVSLLPVLVRRWRSLPDGDAGALPNPLPVTLLFRAASPPVLGLWQDSIVTAIVNHRLKAAGIQVSIKALFEDTPDVSSDIVCAQSAMFLGRRSHINLWPFPSTTFTRDHSGTSVHVESIAFRHALYAASGVQTLLPSLPRGTFTPPEKELTFDLPPMVLGYSRRNSEPDAAPGQAQLGTKRRFSDADEAWFVGMLREEAAANNMTMVTLQVTESTPLADQVSLFAKAGFVVGIHGANLMNSIFMKPFGVLMEIFPALNLQCYLDGSNSGLAYFRYHPIRRATGEESGCTEEHRTCWLYPHNRRVLIGERKDHDDLRAMIRRGIAHLRNVHDRFGARGGVPVVYDEEQSVYRIDWDRET